ncbi:hypothetical protein JL720_9554 [Aureococcus anophagefferens]|nr:hypothetical protein JL720_9554 [Aureococcus anophagefferens]
MVRSTVWIRRRAATGSAISPRGTARSSNCTTTTRVAAAFERLGYAALTVVREPVALAESRTNKLATRGKALAAGDGAPFACSGPDCAAPAAGGATWDDVAWTHGTPLLPARFLSLCDGDVLATPRAGGRDDAACRRPEVRSAALERLRDFAVVGTTERLADTALAFALRFGLDVDGLARAVEGASRRNPSVHYFRLSEATRRALANTAPTPRSTTRPRRSSTRCSSGAARGAEAFDDRRRRFFADAALRRRRRSRRRAGAGDSPAPVDARASSPSTIDPVAARSRARASSRAMEQDLTLEEDFEASIRHLPSILLSSDDPLPWSERTASRSTAAATRSRTSQRMSMRTAHAVDAGSPCPFSKNGTVA